VIRNIFKSKTVKRLSSGILAAFISLSLIPVGISSDDGVLPSETENSTQETVASETESTPAPAYVSRITANIVSETDTSVTLSGYNLPEAVTYKIISNDMIIAETFSIENYTLTGLLPGSYFEFLIEAYHIDGSLIGQSEPIFGYTDLTVSSNYTLYGDLVVADLTVNCGIFNLNSLIRIEDIKTGDRVYSFNSQNSDVSVNRVLNVEKNPAYEIVHISISDNETINATPEHPFYVPAKGWTSALNLRTGDVLYTLNGEYVVVEKVQHEFLENPVWVYNFEVSDDHTYFVGENAVGVHNECTGKNARPSKVTYGHTVEKHGAQNTIGLRGTAASTRIPQGQWLHNENAKNFLDTLTNPNIGEANKKIFEIPDGLGQIITPNGDTLPANKAMVCFKPDGTIRTAYPIGD
jgi:hypothetical protein